MRRPFRAFLTALFLTATFSVAGEDVPLANWPAPPYWTHPSGSRLVAAALATAGEPSSGQQPLVTFPTAPLPFVAITPCRVADTRAGSGFPSGYGPPSVGGGVSRNFTITGQCGIPADAQAVSFNFAVWNTTSYGDFKIYPTGAAVSPVSTLNWGPGTLMLANAAVVPLGTGGAITVVNEGPGTVDLFFDVNGYYSPLGVVRTVNTLSGDLTLAPGTNISITPSGGNTLTITNTGGGGGGLPAGSAGQTLRHNGTSWLANSLLYNDGTRIGIGTTAPAEQLEITGNLALPDSTASSGQIRIGGDRSFFILGNNILIGKNAGNFTMTGGSNIGIGSLALFTNSSGSNNIAIGNYALSNNDTGTDNVVVGTATGGTGSFNTVVGIGSLAFNIAARRNTAVGHGSLGLQSFGLSGSNFNSDNTAVGFEALHSNQPTSSLTGIQNTAVGALSLRANTVGYQNTAVGAESLASNTTGRGATAVGYRALFTQSFDNGGFDWHTGNTAVGYEALYSNQPTTPNEGYNNTAMGIWALRSNMTGALNVAVGASALDSSTSAGSNVAIGSGSLYWNETGNWNTAAGTSALGKNGGSWNVALGGEALLNNVSGGGNVAVGHRAGVDETGSNRLHIGNGLGTLIYGQFDNQRVGIAATDPTVTLDVNGGIRTRVLGAGSVCTDATGILITCGPSDARLKTNVVRLSDEMDVLEALARLRGVRFDWDPSVPRARSLGNRREIGVIAQEVEDVLPEVVSTARDGYKSVDYPKLTAFLLEVAKAQQKEIVELKARLESLERSAQIR